MKKKRATKLLLDSYYSTESNEEGPIAKEIEMEKGGEDTPSDRDHDEPVSVAADPSDLDSNGFDVGKYLERTLSTLPLCELLGEERRLGAEARALDGEMKTLVYENYHKFVIATNTVDSMHRNVGAIEAGLQKLSADVSAAGVCVNSISASLEAKRARLQHLRSVEAHLVRLRAAADLPQRLEQCVSLGAYREAVEYYTRTAALFEHNRTLPSFARISGECAAVIAELKQRLWADLSPQAPRDAKHDTSLAFARTFPGDRVADAAEMLIDLGEPAAAVREAFLETCYSRGAFSAALGALSTSASTIEAETASSVFFSLLAQAHCGYERVFHGIKSVADTDGSSSGDGGNSGGTRTLRSTLAEGAEMYIVTLQRWLATHAQVSSSSNNSNKSRQTLSEEVGFAERLCALARQAAALSASAQTGPNGLTSLGLAERVACVAGDFFGLLVDRVFGDALDSTVAAVVPPLREGCAAHSKAVAAAAGGVSGDSEFVLFWDGTAGSASEAVASAVDAALDEVRVFVTPEFGRTFGDCVADIVIRVHSEMQQFFFKLRERFAALVASYYNPLEPPFM